MTVARELARYKLDLVGVQDVSWDKRGTARAGNYTFFYGKGNESHQLGTGFIYLYIEIFCCNRKSLYTNTPPPKPTY
jgi:hypothetical protein